MLFNEQYVLFALLHPYKGVSEKYIEINYCVYTGQKDLSPF